MSNKLYFYCPRCYERYSISKNDENVKFVRDNKHLGLEVYGMKCPNCNFYVEAIYNTKEYWGVYDEWIY